MSPAGGGGLPPGWPAQVRPPGTPDWERGALAWLFDLCPPDFRGYDVLRRQPVVLAHLAAASVAGAVEGVERGMRTARHDLRDAVDQPTIDATLAVYDRERQRLRAAAVAVAVVAEALRGRRWAARL